MKASKLLLMFLGIFLSCQTNDEDDQQLTEPLSDEEISVNLVKKGKIDPTLLIGEWDLIKFAYTADGKKISDIAVISKVAIRRVDVNGSPINRLIIYDYDSKDYDGIDVPSGPWVFWPYYLHYSISGNLINYLKEDSYIYVMDTFTDEGYDVLNVLMNTYSFVIKGKELIIQFTGEDDKNLLILKKR